MKMPAEQTGLSARQPLRVSQRLSKFSPFGYFVMGILLEIKLKKVGLQKIPI